MQGIREWILTHVQLPALSLGPLSDLHCLLADESVGLVLLMRQASVYCNSL